MKLIIDIPDEYVEQIMNHTEGTTAESEAVNAIRNGTPYEEGSQGEWVFDKENSFTIDMYRCSTCGYFGDTHFKFCPNCGAKIGVTANGQVQKL